jgi:hypothetical protein
MTGNARILTVSRELTTMVRVRVPKAKIQATLRKPDRRVNHRGQSGADNQQHVRFLQFVTDHILTSIIPSFLQFEMD